MLGQPKPSISPPFDMFREIEGIFKRLGDAAPLFDRCQVQDGKRSVVAHRSGLKSMKCSITIEPYLLGARIQIELKSYELRGKREELKREEGRGKRIAFVFLLVLVLGVRG